MSPAKHLEDAEIIWGNGSSMQGSKYLNDNEILIPSLGFYFSSTALEKWPRAW